MITGCKLPPCPLPGIVLFPFKEVHVVAQEDERVRAGTRAKDMAVVVDVAGRDQRRHVTAPHGAVLYEAQLSPAVLMADGVPALMGLNSADRGDRNPAMVGVGVGHHPFWPVEQHYAGTSFGLD